MKVRECRRSAVGKEPEGMRRADPEMVAPRKVGRRRPEGGARNDQLQLEGHDFARRA
jgi:hypothetical protein